MMERSTRGTGLFEPWLAQQRYKQARHAMATYCSHAQSVLDVGCGCVPVFLRTLAVPHRYGLDKTVATTYNDNGISVAYWDACEQVNLPFPPCAFDVITMLAVWEHVPTMNLRALTHSCYECLRPEGVLIITTPSPLGQLVLQPMAWLGFVSKEEIEEHVSVMSTKQIRQILCDAGFTRMMRAHRFLVGFNQLIIAIKP